MNRPLIYAAIAITSLVIGLLLWPQSQQPVITVAEHTAGYAAPVSAPALPATEPEKQHVELSPKPKITDWQASSPPAPPTMTVENIDPQAPINAEQLPPELQEMVQVIFVEFYKGNHEFAALIALDALEISDAYPNVTLMLHTTIGVNYEKLGYIDMAIEQYQQALALLPGHHNSYNALRRLDPEFAANHPELPKEPAPDAGR